MGIVDISGKSAIVYGGARGMGESTCEILLSKHVKVLIADILTKEGKETEERLQAKYPKEVVLFHKCDVTTDQSVQETFNLALERFGSVDIVVSTAGTVDEVNFTKTIDINVSGTVRTSKIAYAHMDKSKGGLGGVIVNTSSVSGIQPEKWGPVYSATKHAVLGFSRSLGLPENYQMTGVRVNCICPATVDTPFLQLGSNTGLEYGEWMAERIKAIAKLRPETVAKVIVDLIEDDSKTAEAVHICLEAEPHYLPLPFLSG